MYNLAISLSSSITVFLAFWFSLPHDYRPWAILIALTMFLGLNFFLSKRTLKQVEALMGQVTKELQNQKFEKAIRTLKSGYKFGKWQFFVEPQINSQIGSIYYLMKEDDNAFTYLLKGFTKHWVAMAMLAILYMKKKDKTNMVATFEKAAKATPKEGMLWSLYAYCMLKEGDRDKALEVLGRGLAKLPGDDKLKANQTAVANKEKMKMRNYGDLWTQFYLEKSPPVGQKIPAYMQALAQRSGGRRMVRK
jgi:tetratricopeptide (TPR) repeat protein